jgi:hypothetical protein
MNGMNVETYFLQQVMEVSGEEKEKKTPVDHINCIVCVCAGALA